MKKGELMEILYIWFHHYGPFREQGFQLCGDLRFKFDRKSELLSVSRNPDYVQDFFSDRMATDNKTAVVTNITALIGNNGSGKTTLLNYIKRYLVHAMGTDIKNALVVMRDEFDETIILYDKSVINLQHVEDQGLLHNTKIYDSQQRSRKLPKSSIIYFSNIFDHSHEKEANDYYNLSTNYLIHGDYRKRLDLQNGDPKQSPIDVHRDEDLSRQVFFIHDYPIRFPEQELPFLPSELVVRIRNIDIEDLSCLGRFASFYEDLNNYVMNKLDEISIFPDVGFNKREELKKQRIHLLSYRTMIYSFLKEISIFTNYIVLENNDPILSFTNVRNGKESFFTYIKKLFSSMLSRLDDEGSRSWLEHLLIMVDLFHYHSGYYSINQNCFKLPIMRDSILKSLTYDFVQVYRRSYRAFPYLDFEWPLSSGEQAFLNVFSRLYSRNDGEVFGSNVKLTKRVLLLIDEGELYFHPEWQRRFIDTLIRFLSVVYGPDRKIQILLTSHSPFILSDLPNYSATFLQRSGKWTNVIDGHTAGFSTLSANIHDLLANGFFLTVNIGEFALQKLNDAITRLNALQSGENTTNSFTNRKEEIDYLRSIIRLVGEPIIAGRMLELLDGTVHKPGVKRHD